jgi:hypothetical protein
VNIGVGNSMKISLAVNSAGFTGVGISSIGAPVLIRAKQYCGGRWGDRWHFHRVGSAGKLLRSNA